MPTTGTRLFGIFSFMKRIYLGFINPPTVPNEPKPIKFGILGAANIAPPALINPAKSHPEVVVYAVAARDKARATAFAKKHGIEKVYGGPNVYQELLDDPEVDAVYNPLPNGLHYEWTMKALAAGKHVLLEKPAADTVGETRQMFELAESKGLVLLEAFHYRFHPAIQRAKSIIASGELGALKSVSVKLMVPSLAFKTGDIRYVYALGGGATMDMGCYTLNVMRYIAGTNPTSVISATPTVHRPASSSPDFVPNIDRAMTATLGFPNDVTGTLSCDLGMPPSFGVIPKMPKVLLEVDCQGGSLEMFNFVMPTITHSLKVTKSTGKRKETSSEYIYTFADAKMEGKGESWWLTYRYQLEAFVDKLKGRTPQTWIDKDDTIANMQWIEQVYEKSGLGVRPKSEYVAPRGQ